MKRLKIHLISDVHLEYLSDLFKVQQLIPNNINQKTCCVLAGDIGYPNDILYEKFISSVKQKFNYVIIIAGNHEYYNRENRRVFDMNQIEQQIEKIANRNNCYFLNKSTVMIEGIKFIGCTFWSYIPVNRYVIVKERNEFSKIKPYFTPKHYNSLHFDHLSYISNELQLTPLNQPTIVVTHHAPSKYMIQKKYFNDPLNCCYYTNQHHLFSSPLSAWFSGHTHNSVIVNINGISSISNCVGYKDEHSFYNLYRSKLSIIC